MLVQRDELCTGSVTDTSCLFRSNFLFNPDPKLNFEARTFWVLHLTCYKPLDEGKTTFTLQWTWNKGGFARADTHTTQTSHCTTDTAPNLQTIFPVPLDKLQWKRELWVSIFSHLRPWNWSYWSLPTASKSPHSHYHIITSLSVLHTAAQQGLLG